MTFFTPSERTAACNCALPAMRCLRFHPIAAAFHKNVKCILQVLQQQTKWHETKLNVVRPRHGPASSTGFLSGDAPDSFGAISNEWRSNIMYLSSGTAFIQRSLLSRGFIHARGVPQTSVQRPELQVPTNSLPIVSAFHVYIASPGPERPGYPACPPSPPTTPFYVKSNRDNWDTFP